MTRLCAYTPPEGILTDIVQYLTTAEHIDLPVDRMQFVTNGDTTHRDKDKVLVSLGMDFQQAATPVSVYARIMVRVEEPQSGTLTGLLPDAVYMAFRLAYHLKQYSLKSGKLISCDIDAAPTLMVDGLRQYAYMVLLCTVPMTGSAGGGGSDTPKEPFKDEYSGDSAKLILNEGCDPELGGMWTLQQQNTTANLRAIFPARLYTPANKSEFWLFNRVNFSRTHDYHIRIAAKPLLLAESDIYPYILVYMTTAKYVLGDGITVMRGNDASSSFLPKYDFMQERFDIDATELLVDTIVRPERGGTFWPSILIVYPAYPVVITHFQVTDITEHPELAPANAGKLLVESTLRRAKMEAALASHRIE